MALILKQPVFRLKRRWRDSLAKGTKRVIQLNAGGFSVDIRSERTLIAGDHWLVFAGKGQDEYLEQIAPPYRVGDQVVMIKRGWLVESSVESASRESGAVVPVVRPGIRVPVDPADSQGDPEVEQDGLPVFPLAPGTPEPKPPVPDDEPTPEMSAALESVRSGVADTSTIASDDASDIEPEEASTASDEQDVTEPDPDVEEPEEAASSPEAGTPVVDSGETLAAIAALPTRRRRKPSKK